MGVETEKEVGKQLRREVKYYSTGSSRGSSASKGKAENLRNSFHILSLLLLIREGEFFRRLDVVNGFFAGYDTMPKSLLDFFAG